MGERAVLVTRPAGQADSLCHLVEAAGFRAVSRPMIEIEALSGLAPPQLQMVQDLDLYQHVIMISSNAVKHGMEYFSQYWPQLPVGIDWYAVGAATAARLSDFGIVAQVPEHAMSSDGLLALARLQQVDGERVLIVKGEAGRTLLYDTLCNRGARVDQLATYRRHCPRLAPGQFADLLSADTFAAVLITSGEGLDNMMSLLSPTERTAWHDMPLVVPGSRVADLAGEMGFRVIFTARNATDEAIMEAFCRCVECEG